VPCNSHRRGKMRSNQLPVTVAPRLPISVARHLLTDDPPANFLFLRTGVAASVAPMQAREYTDETGVHVVALSGEVDLHHSPQLREVLLAHADAKRPALLLDLSEVSYMDSSGLATLIEYLQRALTYKGRFALAGVSDRLRTIFDLARLGEIFAIHPSLDEAKAALASRAA